MARRIISLFGICSGLFFIVIGANEADYMTEIGQVGYRWLEYLLTGAGFMAAGAVLRKVIKC